MEQAGRVKLHELHVGKRRTRAVRHRNAVPRRDVGIARVEIDLARATGCEQGNAGCEAQHIARAQIEYIGAEGAVGFGASGFVRGDQVDCEVVVEDFDVRVPDRAGEQRAFDLFAGRISMVKHATFVVSTFAPEVVVELRFAASVEIDAVLQQGLDRFGSAFDHKANNLWITQTRARVDRVLNVILK